MGKYDAVVKTLPKLPPEVRYSEQGGLSYQEKINKAKEKIDAREPDQLLLLYASARAEAERLEEELSTASLIVEATGQMLMDACEAKGIDSIKVKGAGTLRPDYKPHVKIVDKAAFHEWCLQNGFEAQMDLQWNTTNSIMKERLLANEELPPGIQMYNKPTPVFTKEK